MQPLSPQAAAAALLRASPRDGEDEVTIPKEWVPENPVSITFGPPTPTSSAMAEAWHKTFYAGDYTYEELLLLHSIALLNGKSIALLDFKKIGERIGRQGVAFATQVFIHLYSLL